MRPNPRDARLERIARQTIQAERLLPAGATPVLVAVSGGPDSVALVHFLARSRPCEEGPLPVIAAHVNHGLRGAESDGDAAFLRELMAAWSVPFVESRVRPTPTSEEAARAARYDALRELASETGADRIATAHTADDQMETVLLRLFRGAGLRGLSGMPVRGRVRGARVVRPFLTVTRGQVLEYLRRHDLPYRLDSTNETTRYARNFLRLEVVPSLRERLNPSLRDAILRGASAAREADRYLAAEARRILPSVLRREADGTLSLDAARLIPYPKLLVTYLFRSAVQDLTGDLRDLGAVHIEALLSLVASRNPRSVDLPGGIRARRQHRNVILETRMTESAPEPVPSKA